MRETYAKQPLSKVADVVRGKFSARPRNDPKFYGGEIPFLQTGDIARAGREVTSWSQTLNELGLGVSKLFPSGTIFMSIAANIGDVAISTFDAACPDSVVAVKPRNGVDRDWLFQSLKFAKNDLAALSTQNAQANLSLEKIEPFKIHIPPLPEQRKIAEILRMWDQALEKLTALRAAKERRHRALTISLVFGGNRLEQFRTTGEVKPHRWFSLPASWGCTPIGKLAREVSARNADGAQHEVLSCSKHDGFVRSLEYFKKQVFAADLSGYKKIWRGDFGFPSNHVEEGSIGIQNLTDVGVVSPIYAVFRFDPEKVDGEYAYAVLKTSLYRHIFEVSTSASVDRRGSLRWSEFSKIPFPVPTLAEQKAIAEVLRTSQADIDGLTAEIDALKQQKRGLMQKLLTGEWPVKLEQV